VRLRAYLRSPLEKGPHHAQAVCRDHHGRDGPVHLARRCRRRCDRHRFHPRTEQLRQGEDLADRADCRELVANNNTLPGGSALGLSVDPASPPFTTNSSTKVPNLNSDLLDGQNSTAFLGVNGTAANANKLDGLDSTQFLGVNATAANAQKLDGLDSSQFVVGGGSVSAIHVETGAAVGGVPIGSPGGVVKLLANCFDNSGGQTGTQIALQNISGAPLTVLREGSQGATTAKVLAPNDTDTDMPVLTADHFKWHAHFGDSAFTIDSWSYFDGNNCFFDVRSTFDP
jgi:hypothetical protein